MGEQSGSIVELKTELAAARAAYREALRQVDAAIGFTQPCSPERARYTRAWSDAAHRLRQAEAAYRRRAYAIAGGAMYAFERLARMEEILAAQGITALYGRGRRRISALPPEAEAAAAHTMAMISRVLPGPRRRGCVEWHAAASDKPKKWLTS